MWMSVRVLIQFVTSTPTALTLTAVISAPVQLDIQGMVLSAMVRLHDSEPVSLRYQILSFYGGFG